MPAASPTIQICACILLMLGAAMVQAGERCQVIADASGEPSAGLQLLDPPVGSAPDPGVRLTCADGRLEALRVELEPRGMLAIDLVLTRGVEVEQQFTVALSASGDDTDWLVAVPAAGIAATKRTVIRLQLEAPQSLAPGSSRQALFELSLDDGSLFQLPVEMQIGDEAPLFRDRFEVDPVLGQFSYLMPNPSGGFDR